jgi:hypothetical protein
MQFILSLFQDRRDETIKIEERQDINKKTKK